MIDLKQTLLKVKSKTTVDVKYSRKEHSARVSSLLRVYEQYERQLEGQVRRLRKRATKIAGDNPHLRRKRRQEQAGTLIGITTSQRASCSPFCAVMWLM